MPGRSLPTREATIVFGRVEMLNVGLWRTLNNVVGSQRARNRSLIFPRESRVRTISLRYRSGDVVQSGTRST